jgi:3-oxoacyl-[acyl-carrier protein] reductase
VKENDNVAANGRFDGTTALITGGASGIGLAVAGRVIAEGGVVTLWDVDQAKLDAAQAKFGTKARAKRVDITNPEEVERAVKDTHAAMGHIDILVCAAGVAGLNADVVDYPADEWKRVFDVNINGLFYCNRYVGSLMKARGYGRIVNVASVAGKEGNPRASAYSASKAAVIGFTKSLGKELAKDGVTVNAVAPAVIDTPMLEKVDATHLGYMRSKIPMERFGTVEEVAALICWLASRECSFSTGAVFDISGGRATY